LAGYVQLTPATGQSAPEPAGTYPADHIIRITAKLEFDGKPVVVDELVTCLAEGAGGSTSGRQFLSFQPNRIRVAVDILGRGRNPDRQTMVEQGIPKSDAERFGLLMSETAVGRYKRWPLDLNRSDEHIPWKCQDGFLVPDFDNPGIRYIYSVSLNCIHPDISKGLIWPDKGIVPNWIRFYGELFFDFDTKTLWRMR